MEHIANWFGGEDTQGHKPGVRYERLGDGEEVRMDDFRALNENEAVQGRELKETNVDESQPDADGDQLSWGKMEFDGVSSPAGVVLRGVFVDLLGLEPECLNPRFVRWLISEKDLTVEGTFLDMADLRLSYRRSRRGGVLPHRTFEMGTMTQSDLDLARAEIHGYYDEWRTVWRKKGREHRKEGRRWDPRLDW